MYERVFVKNLKRKGKELIEKLDTGVWEYLSKTSAYQKGCAPLPGVARYTLQAIR